jgi:hypothetical protein
MDERQSVPPVGAVQIIWTHHLMFLLVFHHFGISKSRMLWFMTRPGEMVMMQCNAVEKPSTTNNIRWTLGDEANLDTMEPSKS